jgi:glucosamine-6-phosphate deaminase
MSLSDSGLRSRYLKGTRIPTLVFDTSAEASRHVALVIESLIRQNNHAGRPTVLGLATGSTPVGLYRELIRLHKDAGLDFSRVISFNLDEYYPMPKDDVHSYHVWMRENFFKHVNIRKESIHIPDGTVPEGEFEEYCEEYEQKIKRAGGIDLQILGIGRTGHIGFNEPGSSKESRTSHVTLDPVTRKDATSDFFGIESVPHEAITMGVGTIRDAKKIIIMAFGEHKAQIVQRAIEQPPTDAVTASNLQEHDDVTFILDMASASEMTAVKTPWLLGTVEWTPALVRKAVLWLSLTAKKPLLMLTDDDFRNHELYDLLRGYGPGSQLARRIFDEMMGTICTHPAGPTPQAVLVFSPHPDDDVISMGGTLIHLVKQQHRVHIAYMTSGNIAVFDHDVRRFLDFVATFNRRFDIDCERTGALVQRVNQFLDQKRPGQRDIDEVLEIKGLIRAAEARAGAASVGIRADRLEFMDLQFYRTGTVAKLPISEKDVTDVVGLLERLQPSQIYLAGDLSDPHGTHRMCADAIFQAVRRLKSERQVMEVWLYRGAWQEWEPHQIERVVPINPEEMERKKLAIFKHQSQKDKAMFPGGSDSREFWQRAEDRNCHTAQIYDQLGLPQFFALEGFVQWHPDDATVY